MYLPVIRDIENWRSQPVSSPDSPNSTRNEDWTNVSRPTVWRFASDEIITRGRDGRGALTPILDRFRWRDGDWQTRDRCDREAAWIGWRCRAIMFINRPQCCMKLMFFLRYSLWPTCALSAMFARTDCDCRRARQMASSSPNSSRREVRSWPNIHFDRHLRDVRDAAFFRFVYHFITVCTN